MAQRVHIVVEDDLDGTTDAETVRFGLDGVGYEIDLSAHNAEKLRESLSTYIAAGRVASLRSRRQRSAGASAAEIREWARNNGWEVSDRGRVSSEIRQAFESAHSRAQRKEPAMSA